MNRLFGFFTACLVLAFAAALSFPATTYAAPSDHAVLTALAGGSGPAAHLDPMIDTPSFSLAPPKRGWETVPLPISRAQADAFEQRLAARAERDRWRAPGPLDS